MAHSKLFYHCRAFLKLSAGPDLAAIVSGVKASVSSEINAGIQALDKLIRDEYDAGVSEGIQVIDDGFGKLIALNTALSINDLDAGINQMLAVINGIKFYTLAQNAGVGYDPITRKGGTVSPAGYIDRIELILKKLQVNSKAFKK